tara:strand:- start:2571 stop:3437 length:867 start_codon:yes stop_codon:yes gene_type:complete
MIDRAILLAGGSGNRLKPLTKIINKHLVNIFDKPMIYYSLSILLLMKIKKILIIVNKKDLNLFKKILGNGSQLGIEIKYKIQSKADGISSGIFLGKNFVKNKNFVSILGDNFFYGYNLSEILINFSQKFKSGAQIFIKNYQNTSQLGVVEIKKGKIKKILEKPKNSKSKKIITGIYFLDKNFFSYFKNIKISPRNEFEIKDILECYKKNKQLNYVDLGIGTTWSDLGDLNSIHNITRFIDQIYNIQHLSIGFLEEIAYKNKWISRKKLLPLTKSNTFYSRYVKEFLSR